MSCHRRRHVCTTTTLRHRRWCITCLRPVFIGRRRRAMDMAHTTNIVVINMGTAITQVHVLVITIVDRHSDGAPRAA